MNPWKPEHKDREHFGVGKYTLENSMLDEKYIHDLLYIKRSSYRPGMSELQTTHLIFKIIFDQKTNFIAII